MSEEVNVTPSTEAPAQPSTVEQSKNVESKVDAIAANEINLDALLDQHLSDPVFEQEGSWKGVDYNEVMNQLPDEAKKIVHNLRNDYRKKTTAIAEKNRRLEEESTAVLQNKELFKNLKEKMEIPADLDLYNPDHLQKFIEAKAAAQVSEMLKPAREEMALKSRTREVTEFKKLHSDFDTLRPAIANVIKKQGLKIEDAYYLVKGRLSREEQASMKQELEDTRASARELGFKVTTGRTATIQKPKFTSAWESYQWRKRQGKI